MGPGVGRPLICTTQSGVHRASTTFTCPWLRSSFQRSTSCLLCSVDMTSLLLSLTWVRLLCPRTLLEHSVCVRTARICWRRGCSPCSRLPVCAKREPGRCKRKQALLRSLPSLCYWL